MGQLHTTACLVLHPAKQLLCLGALTSIAQATDKPQDHQDAINRVAAPVCWRDIHRQGEGGHLQMCTYQKAM